MSLRTYLDELAIYCVMCGEEVPLDRKKRRAVTCGENCAKQRNDYLRDRKELRKCKYCGNPSSAEERDEFRAWRRDKLAAKRAAAKAARIAKEHAHDNA